MRVRPRTSISVVFAFFCIVAGAVRPAYVLALALKANHTMMLQQLPDDLGDGSEEDRDQDENDDDVNSYKLVQKEIALHESARIMQQWFIHYHRLFKSHTPELSTPPPRG